MGTLPPSPLLLPRSNSVFVGALKVGNPTQGALAAFDPQSVRFRDSFYGWISVNTE